MTYTHKVPMKRDDGLFIAALAGVRAAGGVVRVSAAEVLRLISSMGLHVDPDGEGGLILRVEERTDHHDLQGLKDGPKEEAR